MKKRTLYLLLVAAYLIFIGISVVTAFEPGQRMGRNLAYFTFEMLKILPCAFVLIGLFEVWIKRKTIEKHLGRQSGLKGHMLGIMLAATTVGGLYVSFPVAYSLHRKGARLEVIFTYISASAICRVPMTIFEASFLGARFSLIRLLVSIPLVVVTSMVLGRFLEKQHYTVMEG